MPSIDSNYHHGYRSCIHCAKISRHKSADAVNARIHSTMKHRVAYNHCRLIYSFVWSQERDAVRNLNNDTTTASEHALPFNETLLPGSEHPLNPDKCDLVNLRSSEFSLRLPVFV